MGAFLVLNITAFCYPNPPPSNREKHDSFFFQTWRATVTSSVWGWALIGPCLCVTFIVWQREDLRETLQSWGYLLLPATVLSPPCRIIELNSRGGTYELSTWETTKNGKSCLMLRREGCSNTGSARVAFSVMTYSSCVCLVCDITRNPSKNCIKLRTHLYGEWWDLPLNY